MPESATTNPIGDAGRLSASLRTLFGVGTLAGLTDGQLLERFLRGRGGAGEAVPEAEAAFGVLVERHGPMVLGVGRAILGDRHDAEDACQAAFLVLARRAGSIRRGESVASWLYGVARRIAARARRDLSRRRELERRRLARTARSEPVAAPPAEPWPELYEELDRLPEPFRAAVVLCDLEGYSYEQAAGLLGCPLGTLQSRLARGRERLRGRLERRGIAPAVIGIGSGLNLAAHPVALSTSLTVAIVRAAVGIIGGRTIAAAAPAAVAALAGAEVRRHVMRRLAMTLTMLVAAGAMATTALVLASGGRGDDPGHRPPAAAKQPDPGPIHVRVVDLQGKGVPGIAVEVRGGDRPRSFATGADGRAAIPRELFAGGGVLVARRGSEAFAWGSPFDLSPGRPAGAIDDPIVMKLLPVDHRVQGSIVDQAGKPLLDIRVQAFSLRHPVNGSVFFGPAFLTDLVAPTSTDRAGRFAMQVPREAGAFLRASHPRYIGPWINAQPGARDLGTSTLEPGGGIAGLAIDAATGRPVAGAVLGAQLVEHRARILGGWGETTSDDQGRFLLGGLEPGVYNLLLMKVPVRPDATARAVEGVRVRAGSDTPAHLAIIDGRPLRGVVIDRDTGEPVPGIQVGCYGPARPRSGAAVESHRADDQGRFTFHIPPGEQYVYLQEGDINSRLARRTVVVPEKGEVETVRLMRRDTSRRNAMIGYAKAAAPAIKKALGPPPDEPTKVEVAEETEPAPAQTAVSKAAVKAEEYRKAIRPAQADVPQGAKAPAEAPKVRSVTGHVRDPQGRPLAGVQLQAAPDPFVPGDGPRAFGLPMTDHEGLFLFPDLPRRPLKITLTRPGYRYQSVDLQADRDEVQWTFELVPDLREKDQPAPTHDEPVPPGLRDRLTFVELEPWGTDYLADGPGGMGNDLNRLPRGIHKLGETYFRVGEKMVHLKGQMRADLPQAVKGIKVQARGRVLHFLHSTQEGLHSTQEGADTDDQLIGAYVIHYADGSIEQAPVVYARDITNWWHRDPGRRITRARPAWTGGNDMTEQQARLGLQVRLFDMPWTNPHPEKEIASLDVLSAGKECDPFLVAVTLERDR